MFLLIQVFYHSSRMKLEHHLMSSSLHSCVQASPQWSFFLPLESIWQQSFRGGNCAWGLRQWFSTFLMLQPFAQFLTLWLKLYHCSWVVVAHAFNLSSQEAEADKPLWVRDQSRTGSKATQSIPCLEKNSLPLYNCKCVTVMKRKVNIWHTEYLIYNPHTHKGIMTHGLRTAGLRDHFSLD